MPFGNFHAKTKRRKHKKLLSGIVKFIGKFAYEDRKSDRIASTAEQEAEHNIRRNICARIGHKKAIEKAHLTIF